MDFSRYLKSTNKQLDKQIRKILGLWLKEAISIDRKLVPLAEEFIKSNFGGKGIRGGLVRLGYELVLSSGNGIASSKTPRNDVVRVGAAYEILHTSILVHDDIIDQSPTRRGRKSLYESIGISEAITLGDLGFFLAVKIISESSFPDSDKIRALKLFSKTMVNTALGQMLDIQKGNPKTLILYKTAYYTISAPLQLGAILGGADRKLLGLLGLFGENLGIAYQIKDDILDGDALDYAKQEELKYVAMAKKMIPRITSDNKMQKLLLEMADYTVERTK